MKKYFLPFSVLLLAGCPSGDRINLSSADVKLTDGKLCVYVKEKFLLASENILRISIWSYEEQKNIYEKTHTDSSPVLKANRCLPDLDDVNFSYGYSYSVTISTPLHSYVTPEFQAVNTAHGFALSKREN